MLNAPSVPSVRLSSALWVAFGASYALGVKFHSQVYYQRYCRVTQLFMEHGIFIYHDIDRLTMFLPVCQCSPSGTCWFSTLVSRLPNYHLAVLLDSPYMIVTGVFHCICFHSCLTAHQPSNRLWCSINTLQAKQKNFSKNFICFVFKV